MNPENKKPFTSVGIIGCGWLGKVLASELHKKHVAVLATSSQPQHVELLNQQGIKALQLSLPAQFEQLSQHAIFRQKSLVIAITPQFKQGRTDYANKVTQLVEAAEQVGVVERIVLLTSTAIYQGLTGMVDEKQTLNLRGDKAQILKLAEQAVLNFTQQANVLRLAGLVGPQRHPGKFLQANKILSNPSAPVNLIHQQDAVGLIQSLLFAEAPQGIFNGVSDTHVTKAEYYHTAAKTLGLEGPRFGAKHLAEESRVVSGRKVQQQLNYSFIYPDLLAWL